MEEIRGDGYIMAVVALILAGGSGKKTMAAEQKDIPLSNFYH